MTRRAGWESSCSGRCRRRKGVCTAPSGTASPRTRASSRTTPTSRTGCYELHVATGEPRWLDESRRLALLAVELFGDDERGGFFLTPADGEELVARKKEFDDNPTPSGNSMLAYVLLRLARIHGDAELERRAVDVFRLLVDPLRRAPSAFGWALCALDLYFSPPRELAIFAEPRDEIARAALAPWQPNAVVAFGPADGVAAPRGEGARRRQADRVRLRELRLPRAGDRGRRSRYADAVASRPSAAGTVTSDVRRGAGSRLTTATVMITPSHCVQRRCASKAT